MEKRKKIAVRATGGTIAAVGAEGETNNYTSYEIGVQQLVGDIPGIYDLAELMGVQVCNIPSTDVTERHWYDLAKTIDELAGREDIDGFVVTHGTDTLEETAYCLQLVVKTQKPIVITGAMRPASAISADGPMNLFQSIALAASDVAYGMGVLAVFSDGIYTGRDVQKANCFRPDAFNQKDFGCIGYMLYNKPVLYYKPLRKHTVDTAFTYRDLASPPRVNVAYFAANIGADILYDIAKKSDGLIIAGSGGGWYSTEWIEMSKKLEELGIPVVRSSRVGNGFVQEVDCLDYCQNYIPGDTLNPAKAKILLQLALAQKADYKTIRKYFEEY